MSMPFQWPSAYASAVHPPEEPPERSLWFVFRGGELLVAAIPAPAAIPHCNNPKDLGMMPLRTQYLGVLGAEHCFSAEAAAEAQPPQGWSWQGLRGLFGALDDAQFALAGRAVQIVEWDRTHQYCGACGEATVPRTSERSRECPRCRLVVYPRLAPAVMGLVRRERSLLLARSPRFPEGMYTSSRVRNARYFASQPWPFPNSLMIAFFADYVAGEIRADGVEIVDAQWFDVEDLPRLPAKISVARRLIDAAIGEMLAA
jgi:NAD+ diphosphatase